MKADTLCSLKKLLYNKTEKVTCKWWHQLATDVCEKSEKRVLVFWSKMWTVEHLFSWFLGRGYDCVTMVLSCLKLLGEESWELRQKPRNPYLRYGELIEYPGFLDCVSQIVIWRGHFVSLSCSSWVIRLMSLLGFILSVLVGWNVSSVTHFFLLIHESL